MTWIQRLIGRAFCWSQRGHVFYWRRLSPWVVEVDACARCGHGEHRIYEGPGLVISSPDYLVRDER